MNTTSNLSELMQTYYDKLFLRRAKPLLVMDQFAQTRPIPQGEGKIIQFTKYTPLPKATTPLTEGLNPAGVNLSATSSSAVLAEYGDFGKISSIVSLTALDHNIKEKVQLFADQAALTLDWLLTAEVATNATEQIAGGKAAITNLNATDVLTTKEIRKAVRTMKKNKALKIGGYFIGVLNPDTEYDFTGDAGWVEAAKYAGSTQLWEGEIGKWFGVRMVGTTEPYVYIGGGNAGVDVYSNLIIGAESYGVIPLAGNKGPTILVKIPGPSDTSNPLNRFSTCGWVAIRTWKVLQPAWVLNIKTGVSA